MDLAMIREENFPENSNRLKVRNDALFESREFQG
jgi:hypothetical protein